MVYEFGSSFEVGIITTPLAKNDNGYLKTARNTLVQRFREGGVTRDKIFMLTVPRIPNLAFGMQKMPIECNVIIAIGHVLKEEAAAGFQNSVMNSLLHEQSTRKQPILVHFFRDGVQDITAQQLAQNLCDRAKWFRNMKVQTKLEIDS